MSLLSLVARVSQLLLFFASPYLSSAPLEVEVSAQAAILLSADTGEILFEKEAHTPHFPASISKVATALCVLEALEEGIHPWTEAPLQAISAISAEEKRKRGFKTPSHWIEFGSSHVGIKKGERLSVETLLYGMLLQSGNDAANVLAHHVAGDIPLFVEQLNDRLRDLGCQQTCLTNPHGLHHPEQVTSAYDMAIITREALRYPLFRTIVASRSFRKPASNLQPETIWPQKNRLVKPGKWYDPRIIGVKPGYTRHAKGTLVAAAEMNGRTLIAVVLRCTPFSNAYKDARGLFDAAFEQPLELRCIVEAGAQPYTLGRVSTYLQGPIEICAYPWEAPVLETRVEWRRVELPVERGEQVGELIVETSGRELARAPLLAQQRVKKSWHQLPYLGVRVGIIGLALLLVTGLIYWGRRKQVDQLHKSS